MESSASFTITCKRCNSITLPVEKTRSEPFGRAKCKTEACQCVNFITVCPFCNQELKSLDQAAFSSGKKITCTCNHSMRLVGCPYEKCSRINYFTDDTKYIMGGKIKCSCCDRIFQQVTCPHCYASNYGEGTANSYYNSGVITPCFACKKSFQHLICPHCKCSEFFPDCNYLMGVKQRCKECKKEYQHVNCPKCLHSNVFPSCIFQYGTPNTCKNDKCNATFEVTVCPRCFKENANPTQQLPDTENNKFLETKKCWSCNWEYHHILCTNCSEPMYPDIPAPGAQRDFQCPCCKNYKIKVYNCQYCNKISITNGSLPSRCNNRSCNPPNDRFQNILLSALTSNNNTFQIQNNNFNLNSAPLSTGGLLGGLNTVFSNSNGLNLRNNNFTPSTGGMLGTLNLNPNTKSPLTSLFSAKPAENSNGLIKASSNLLSTMPKAENTETDGNRDSRACCICMDRKKSILFQPCNHYATCNECAQRIINKKCPICNQKYNSTLTIYEA